MGKYVTLKPVMDADKTAEDKVAKCDINYY